MEEKIPELEKRENEDYENEPLLEYVVRFNDYFFPKSLVKNIEDKIKAEGTKVEDIEILKMIKEDIKGASSQLSNKFAQYYLQGEIDTSMATAYLEHEDVQNTLIALDLDKHKFWYLCLMLKDYVRGCTENARPRPKWPREELEEFVQEIDKLEPVYDPIIHLFRSFKHAAELTLQVKGKGRKNARNFTIQNPTTLFHIGKAIHELLNKDAENNNYRLNEIIETESSNETTTETEIWRVALFHKYLNWFLDIHRHQPNFCPIRKISKTVENTTPDGTKQQSIETITPDLSHQHLISRMIYLMGISKNEKYNDPQSCILKDNLKGKYKNPEPRNYNSRYSE